MNPCPCPYTGECRLGCASAEHCYRQQCDDLCDHLLAASAAGASGREIDDIFIAGKRQLGAPEGEIVTWLGYARQ